MKLIFPLLFVTVFLLIHLYVYFRVVKKLHFSDDTKKILSIFLGINFLGVVLYMLSRFSVDLPQFLYFALSLSIGAGFGMFVFALIYDILEQLHKIIPPQSQKRREFLKKSIDGGFLGAGALYMGIGIDNGLEKPRINPVKVDTNSLKTTIKIAQISDLHIGGIIDKNYVKEVVKRINIIEPDIVAITGDLIDTSVERSKEAINELKNIRSKHGVYFCAGNHEYFHGLQNILEALKKCNIKVLENSVETLSINGETIQITGVYDLFGYRYGSFEPNLEAVKKSIIQNVPTIFLVHQPKFIKEFKELDFYPTLTLSGHTHGGQIFPFGILVRLEQPYLKGLHKLKERSFIYVNSGSGFWGPPMRVGSSSEISAIEFS